MKKTTLLFVLLLLMPITLAGVPVDNRMKIGTISSILPAEEMKSYYVKMEPVMLKYFGPPFSEINMNVEADPTKNEHATGFIPETQTLLLAGQAQTYVKFKDTDPQFALNNILGSTKHELSHGMYMYNKDMFGFGKQWPFEGWAKVLENIMVQEIDGGGLPGLGDSYLYYMDKEIVGGTERWGGSKQTTNHGNIYGIVGGVHMLLLYTASSSYSNLDFYKKMNNALYDYIKSKNLVFISLDEYKSVMKPLLSGIKVDGQDAFEWYFNNPAAFSDGKLEAHVNAFVSSDKQYAQPVRLTAYAFDRQEKENGKTEVPLANQQIKVVLKDSLGKEIWSKTLSTDTEGNAFEDVFEEEPSWEDGAYSVYGETKTNNQLVTSNYFMINPPKIEANNNYVYGVLLDTNKNLVSGKYISLLQADVSFIYKKNGLFILNVPPEQKIAKLNFLGKEQEVTKPPFARVFAFTISDDYLTLAGAKSAEELEQGIVEVPEELTQQEQGQELGPKIGYEGKGCGDGLCDEFETENNACSQDCGGEPGSVERAEQVPQEEMAEQGEQVSKEWGMKPKGFFTKIFDWFLNLLGLERKTEDRFEERPEGEFEGPEGDGQKRIERMEPVSPEGMS